MIGFNEVQQMQRQTFIEEEQPQRQTGLMRLGSGIGNMQDTFDRFNGAMAKQSNRIKVNVSPRNRKRNTKQQPSIAKRR